MSSASGRCTISILGTVTPTTPMYPYRCSLLQIYQLGCLSVQAGNATFWFLDGGFTLIVMTFLILLMSIFGTRLKDWWFLCGNWPHSHRPGIIGGMLIERMHTTIWNDIMWRVSLHLPPGNVDYSTIYSKALERTKSSCQNDSTGTFKVFPYIVPDVGLALP